MQMRFCEIAGKQVINLCDGRVVGLVNDVAFDVKSNKLLAIYARTTQPFVKKCCHGYFLVKKSKSVCRRSRTFAEM